MDTPTWSHSHHQGILERRSQQGFSDEPAQLFEAWCDVSSVQRCSYPMVN